MAEPDDDATDPKDAILDAALPDVAFDGWSETLLRRAAETAGVPLAEARLIFPRGGLDLAAEAHRRGDRRLAGALGDGLLDGMRIREKVTRAVRARLTIAGEWPEATRRAAALFSLPGNVPEGMRLTWGTADAIWNAVGDRSDDVNWYTKRLTLSGVYWSTLLYWLGDESVDSEATWRFLDRRIEDVMRFEKVKGALASNPLARALTAGPRMLLSRVRAPGERPGDLGVGYPGRP